jgi:antirestriction protein ArdC
MVTDRIVAQLEQGLIPWHKPWTGVGIEDGGAVNYVSRKPYSMLNQMLLGREGEYLTFKQIKERGGSIKKGAKAGVVVFFTTTTYTKREEVQEDGSTETVSVMKEHLMPVLKYYNVFHIDDCEGIESKIKVEEDAGPKISTIESAEKVLNGYVEREKELQFRNNIPTDRAYYSPTLDLISVPMLSQYEIAEEYYSTTFHEAIHSTMPENRCNRKSEQKLAAFGSEDYSREELVAEIGSAMLCNNVGIDCEKAFKNSVAYIQGWLKKLKNDNRMIVWAASRAEKAAKYILGEPITTE